jgi:hypothetical protein
MDTEQISQIQDAKQKRKQKNVERNQALEENTNAMFNHLQNYLNSEFAGINTF